MALILRSIGSESNKIALYDVLKFQGFDYLKKEDQAELVLLLGNVLSDCILFMISVLFYISVISHLTDYVDKCFDDVGFV